MKKLTTLLYIAFVMIILISCSAEIAEENEVDNSIFSIEYLGYDETSSASSVFFIDTKTASEGAIFKVITFKATNKTNSVQYIGDIGMTYISMVLPNNHEYSGTSAESYKFFPEQTREITVIFEVMKGEKIDGARVTFSPALSVATNDESVVEIPSNAEKALPDSKIKESLIGLWERYDHAKDKYDAFVCFKENNTVLFVDESGYYDGTWALANQQCEITVPDISLHYSFTVYYKDSYIKDGSLVAFSIDDSDPAYPVFQKARKGSNTDIIYAEDYTTFKLSQLNNRYFATQDRELIYYFASDGSGSAYLKGNNGNYDALNGISWEITGTILTIKWGDVVLLSAVHARGSDPKSTKLGFNLYFLGYEHYEWLPNGVNINIQQ